MGELEKLPDIGIMVEEQLHRTGMDTAGEAKGILP